MLYFRSCPRCKTGTIQLDFDLYGTFMSCLNCGFEKSAASVRKLNFEESETAPGAGFTVVEPVAVAAVAEADMDDDDVEDDFFDDEDEEAAEEVPQLRRVAG